MNFDQKQNIGFIHIIEKLSPKSGYGKKLLKKISPFNNKESLLEEFFNLEIVIDLIQKNNLIFDSLNSFLSHIKDISNSFNKIGNELNQIELLEIKNFCYYSILIANEIQKANLPFKNLTLPNLELAFELLNKTNSTGFIIGDEYSTTLTNIRKKKRTITQQLIHADPNNRKKFEEEHLILSVKEQEEENRICLLLSSELLIYKNKLQKASEIIGKIDLLIQKGYLLIEENGIIPKISNNNFEFIDAVNPFIAEALANNNKKFTPISITLKGVTVITGSNMGGKTVALKTVALNSYCALCGLPIFAKQATVPFLDFIEILSENLQSSERGLSSFGGEIIKINELYDMAKNKYGLLLLDEFASGTNFQEGSKIFSALLRALKNTPSFSVLTTHFDGVCDEASYRYQIIGLSASATKKLANLSTGITPNMIAEYMNYGLVKTDNSAKIPKNAIDVCKLLGLNKDIISLIEN